MKISFYEKVKEDADRLLESADAYENGDLWVGSVLVPSQDDRMRAAEGMRQQADSLMRIYERRPK